jgi:hypothetical protein
MRHYRLRVILLSLGVALGYGAAFGQLLHARHHPHAGWCWPWGSEPQRDAGNKQH